MPIISAPSPECLKRCAVVEAAAAAPIDLGYEAYVGAEGEALPLAADPLPIYSIPPGAVHEGAAALDQAKMHGWRILTQDRSGRALVDFVGQEPGEEASAIHRARAAELLLRAGSLAAARGEEPVVYEPRIFELAWLGFSALWLHSDEAVDRFYTMEDEPRELHADDVFAALAPRARRRLDVTESASAAAGVDAGPRSLDLGG